MVRRKRIGIIYSYDEGWIGGTYYYQNLIRSLKLLSNNKKPHLVIVCSDKGSFKTIKSIGYPYISFYILEEKQDGFLDRLKTFFNYPVYKRSNNFGIDVLFHPSELTELNTIENHLYWIPDFQEKKLPHLFPKEFLEIRQKTQRALLTNDKHVLFSSQDALKDFNDLYPNSQTNRYVANFKVFHPDYSDIKLQFIQRKYALKNKPYFFSPNQFWEHKNHIVVLKAIKVLRDCYNIDCYVLFSGKEYDLRNPNYFKGLIAYVKENNLDELVRFLGFIDRKDQLFLMKNAKAVIQPSLFEGWSTVVEDVKAMDQNIIVSNLAVHKEQLQKKGYFFNPLDVDELVEQMLMFIKDTIDKPAFHYRKDLGNFGEEFINIIDEIA